MNDKIIIFNNTFTFYYLSIATNYTRKATTFDGGGYKTKTVP